MIKIYNVKIQAESGEKKLEFVEVVEYYISYREECIREAVRESKAVKQVKEKMPWLRNVRAISSISP